MTEKSEHAGLLEAILSETEAGPEAGPTAPEVTPRTAEETLLTDGAGIVWRLTDPATGRAERVTALPKRSATRKPAELVRYFPPLVPTEQRNMKALLSAVAGDPLRSQKLVTLLAHNAPDRRAASYILGANWKMSEAEVDQIVSAYLAIRERGRA